MSIDKLYQGPWIGHDIGFNVRPIEFCSNSMKPIILRTLHSGFLPTIYTTHFRTNLSLYVTTSKGPALMGGNWLSEISLDWGFLKLLRETTDSLVRKYAELFDGQLGKVDGIKAKLEMKPEARPKFHKPRTVLYALPESIETELRLLVSAGILKKINYSDYV